MVPYDILRCSWPRPAAGSQGRWVSEPEWDAPLMHLRPQPVWRSLGEAACFVIDWRELFRGSEAFGGQMRGFHVVFEIRVRRGGRLLFHAGDGCVVRRAGEVVCECRGPEAAERQAIEVEAGDRLEIAQWQSEGDWAWGARIEERPCDREERVRAFLPLVKARLAAPTGPPLKMYCHGGTPLRTVVSLYSMILNGYRPSAVHLYGEYQWPAEARRVFGALVPFARVAGGGEVEAEIGRAGGEALVDLARRHWFVMKTCVSLLCGPGEFCLMDDDIFVVGAMDDALAAFGDCDFVFAPDAAYEQFYQMVWQAVFGRADLGKTSGLNTGLYWLRLKHDREEIAGMLLAGGATVSAEWAWEQGFFAHLYAGGAVHRLSPQRYFYPLFDGLPGGVMGYDYALNPCGFASIHFGGPVNKPGDTLMDWLAPQLLRERTHLRAKGAIRSAME